MTGGTTQRTVEVATIGSKSYGSGCLIAPGVVLTAHHVVGAGTATVVVRDTASALPTEASRLWENAELDVVLLHADPKLVGADVSTVRFGELVSNYPARRPRCTMTGFPRGMRRRHLNVLVNDLKTIDGHINAHTGSRSGLYGFEIDDALPAQAKHWQGLSGAGVFCEGMLVGLAHSVPLDWQGQLLMALPVSRLLAADGFLQAVTDATGTPPRLEPADLKPLFDDAPKQRLSSSYLLHPRSRVVPLTGMTHLLDPLEQWCRGTDSVDVAAITGLGGIGKSRLVPELLDRLSQPPTPDAPQRPWSGGFLSERPRRAEYDMLASATYPLLIAVDYAETRIHQVQDLFRALNERDGGDTVRVLLIARGHDNWWPALRRTYIGQHVMPRGETIRTKPGDAARGRSAEDLYTDAHAAFTRHVQLLQQTRHQDETRQHTDAPRLYGTDGDHSAEQPVIHLHIAALADVLARANPELARNDSPMEVLLANEENYLLRVAATQLPAGTYDAKLIRALVAAQHLAGAATAGEGQAAVSAGFDVYHRGYTTAGPPDPRQLAAWDTVLSAAYPSTSGAHWGAMGPAPLVAALIADVERNSGHEFVEDLLLHPSLKPPQRRQTLRVIARAADTQPELAEAAHRAVAADPQLLLRDAAKTIAAELDHEPAREWLTGLHDAVTEEAERPDADPDTYRWATTLVDDALTQRDSPTEDLDELFPPPEPEQDEDDVLGTDEGNPPTTAQPASDDAIRVKPRMARALKALVTVIALTHLACVAYVTGYVAYFTEYSEPGVWGTPVIVVAANILIAFLWGPWHLRGLPILWFAQLMPSAFNIASGVVYSQSVHAAASPGTATLAWGCLFVPGWISLVIATRAWFGLNPLEHTA
ncbi:trypsin-like peptidase domain-containing protein [Streptomyces mirabilis]|uniref:trypsin-like peptidase domain-containing protein n=1 Tax=Streptomyces mirabilis TaxID=68239 RepID=UPI00368E7EAF